MAANKKENFGNKSSEQRKKLAQNCFSFSFHGKVLLSLKAQRVSKGILATNIFFPISIIYFNIGQTK
jgi:hypothetical protein